MKNDLILICILLLLASCHNNSSHAGIYVQNFDELNTAIGTVTAGGEIIMANGVWKDVQIKFFGQGTKDRPITLRAENPGQVFIEGQSFLHLGGENLIVNGLYFRNGFTPNQGIIRYKIGLDSVANNCRVTGTVIVGFTRPYSLENDRWIEFYGKHNQLDHCYIAGKATDGSTLMVYHDGNENTDNYHQIVNNYFGPRPRNNGSNGETIRFGDPKTRLTPGRINVSNNYFEGCNGDVEVISDMTNYNSFTKNIFYKCEGSLVLRHGNYATVDSNIFIGGNSDLYGGLAVMNTGHWITNNYFYKIKGNEFRTPLALMNGIKNTPIYGYRPVTDVVVAYNTWVDCKSPWQIGVGQNKDSVDLLSVSELRSEPPIRSTLANNLIYNTQADETPVINHDDIRGILFKNNVIDNNGSKFTEYGALRNGRVNMKQINEWLYAPTVEGNEFLNDVYMGYDFARINQDLFGSSRSDSKRVGAINQFSIAEDFNLDKKQYGPEWFSPATSIPTKNNSLTAQNSQ